MRAPGMTMFRMPIFTWNMFVTSLLILMTFPVLTAAGAMLFVDRHFGAHIFDAANGGCADPVAAPVLVVRPPRGVHPRAAVLRRVHRDLRRVLAPAGVRLQGHRLRHAGDRLPVASACGPTTCSRPAPSLLAFFSVSDDAHRRADGREVLQLDRHDVGRQARLQACPLAVGHRVPADVPDRRPDAARCWPPPRSTSTCQRLVLPRRPLPLRAVRRLGVRHLRRRLLLVPEVDRAAC